MNKNVKDHEYEVIEDKTTLLPVKLEDEMKKSFIAYAMAVNVSRAIPDIRDGMKPVHRRILFAMNELGLSNDKPYRKCARIVGDVLGKYHPHGDSAVYDALVRLAQPFSINCPLVDGQGNFGSVDGDPPAAQRYTEARLSKIAAEMLRDIDKKTVDFYPNFDDTLEQPTVLPSRYPNLLVNGSDGIAVGMATSIPPHNLGEVIDGTVALLDNPDISIEELVEYIPAPDFPTGALVYGRAAIRQAYMTGKGAAIIRARAEIEEHNNRQRIIITEIPYQVNKAKLIETMADMVRAKKLDGISDIREESDRKGMRIVVEVKRDANAQVVLNSLYKHTKLQTTFGMIMLALLDGVPTIVNLKQILVSYAKHQTEVILRRTRFDLEKAEEKHHILLGLQVAINNIDEVVDIIKKSADRPTAQENLMARFGLSDKQANAILEMRLSRLTGLEEDKIRQDLADIEVFIADMNDILARPERVTQIIKDELLEIKAKYATPRQSEISMDYSDIDLEDLIAREDVVVSLTNAGYVKRMAVAEYRTQHRGGRGVNAHKTKEEDFVTQMFTTSTHSYLLFFTNLGRVFRAKCYEIPEGAKVGKGRAMVNLLQLEAGERVQAILPDADNGDGYLVLATRNGLIKKTRLPEYHRINRSGKIAIRLLDDDALIGAELSTGHDDFIMATHDGKCIRFSEELVRPVGRASQGVRSIRMDEGDYVVDMTVVDETKDVLTVTEKGYGKRTSVDEYRSQGRAGKGLKAGNFTDKTGKLVSMKLVSEDEDLLLITDGGVIIRIAIATISKIGRGSTQGVKLMRVEDTSSVQSVALAPHQEDEPEENTEGAEGAAEGTAVAEATAVTEDTATEPEGAAAPIAGDDDK